MNPNKCSEQLQLRVDVRHSIAHETTCDKCKSATRFYTCMLSSGGLTQCLPILILAQQPEVLLVYITLQFNCVLYNMYLCNHHLVERHGCCLLLLQQAVPKLVQDDGSMNNMPLLAILQYLNPYHTNL